MSSYLKYGLLIAVMVSCKSSPKQATEEITYAEPHRPQFHFSPKEKWMNDPNGMVFYNDQYHLFYQYYPDSTVWGPMHWGHATTTDLVHWKHQPVALYPDSLGYIFSGSAVADINNTSGFGKNGKVPLIAMFTHHDPKGEKEGKNDYQNQSLAYSLDEGKSWIKYDGNPVLKNPGIKDFRDPKISWHEESKKWIMALAVSDHISFYSSPNLKDWNIESEFGKKAGAHGGVWECPDIFSLDHNGQAVWVLLVSINPGGPNGGSATQYFTGSFDGHTFKANHTNTKWIDYGPDNYAGVTWSNTGDRKIFLGWMSNWQYANVVPTKAWRSAMTIPRELALAEVDKDFFLISKPVKESDALNGNTDVITEVDIKGEYDLSGEIKNASALFKLEMETKDRNDFSVVLSNDKSEEVIIGYDKQANQYYIDRSRSGETGFEPGFAGRHLAPRISKDESIKLTIIADVASVELFADNGLTVMTSIFFPEKRMTTYKIKSAGGLSVRNIKFTRLKAAKENTK